MSHLPPPAKHLVDRAFETGEHIGEPYCGTAYCPVCLHEEMGAALSGPRTDTVSSNDIRRAGSLQAETFLSSPALALRAIQKYDELMGGASPAALLNRHLLIAAEDALGVILNLTCTGEPSSWHEDGSVGGYDHNGDTCPIHEWLVESDQKEVSDGDDA